MKGIFLGAALLLLYFYWQKAPQRPFTVQEEVKQRLFLGEEGKAASSSSSLHPLHCSGKKKCLVVYLTPWCPACTQFKAEFFPALKSILEKSSKNLGMTVIIGKDQEGKLRRMEADMAVPVLLDPSGDLYQKLKIKAVPTFLVVQPDGMVVKSQMGFQARGNSIEDAVANFLLDLID